MTRKIELKSYGVVTCLHCCDRSRLKIIALIAVFVIIALDLLHAGRDIMWSPCLCARGGVVLSVCVHLNVRVSVRACVCVFVLARGCFFSFLFDMFF